jgi:mannan endo-1,4-beta-mannosidase
MKSTIKSMGLFFLAIFVVAGCSGSEEKSILSKTTAAGLVDQNATPETVNLYQNMKKLATKGVMFGHQDDLAYGIGWKYEEGRSDVKEVVGSYPAVFGWEIGHLELGRSHSLDTVHFDKMREYMIQVYNMNGINTISWHGDNPMTGGSTWDVSQKGVVRSILPGAENHQTYLGMLDKLADFFLSIKTEDGTLVPLLFRPYHEHTGSWFWWGKNLCTVDEYVQLWRFTVDYFRNVKNVNNLIYSYSPDRVTSAEDYFERYPGDDYVDILGFDIYHREGEKGIPRYLVGLNLGLKIITDAAKVKNKVAALTETGLEQIPVTNWWTEVFGKTILKYPISYALVWRNAYEIPNHYFAPYPGHPSSDDFKKFFNHSSILFQKDMPNIYQ